MSNKFYNTFIKNIGKLGLIKPNEKVLLTVSGGIDSITMFHLFLELDIPFAVAHCNFQLRGAESDGDQQFVEDLAATHKKKCFTVKFNTKEFASENKISIQMAARELRYNWFEKIASENGYNKIATAHNLNDVVETFFINLTRGSGLKGLTGISPVNGKIIRPLLFATRNEIVAFANDNNLKYREDSSNAETKYLRNAIRHKIIPEFEKLNPSFLNSVLHSSKIIQEANFLFKNEIDTLKNKLLRSQNESIYINISELKEHKISPEIFFEILSEYGFSFDSAVNILECLDNQSGLCFYSEKFKLIKDRNDLIIQQIQSSLPDELFISGDVTEINFPVFLKLNKYYISEGFTVLKGNTFATFDFEKIKFPLKLRKWQDGDFFYPFGMEGKKKISDYFTDQKFSLFDKENAWLLISGEDIIWIVGYRTDNRYRITENTKVALQIELIL